MFVIRPAKVGDASAIAQVQVDTWRTAYKDLMSAETLANMSVEQSTANWQHGIQRDGRICYVATVDDVVVGFAYGARCRDEALEAQGFDGEIYALYVRDAQQNNGVGRRLINASAQELYATGYTSMAIWVLKSNMPARGFYEKMGGIFIEEKTINVRGQDLVEVAYGWADLSVFLKQT